MKQDPESLRCVKAKVVEIRSYGEEHEPRSGTKHFKAGAKVFVIDAYWGMCDAVTVIGHHRASGRYAKLDMSVMHLSDFALTVVYSPKALALIDQHFSGRHPYTEDYAESLLEVLPVWQRR
ncbi:MAG: hypothetical protein AAGC71_03735 [Pseudomonadota bacterium]